MTTKQRIALGLQRSVKVMEALNNKVIEPEAAGLVALALTVGALTDALMLREHGEGWDQATVEVVPADKLPTDERKE